MVTIRFHATKDDLLTILEIVEGDALLKYVQTGNFVKNDLKDGIKVFEKGDRIPNLGIAAGNQSAVCDSYLVCERDTPVNLRRFRGNGGEERICIDQLINPDTVAFRAGGLWGEDILLCGNIGTCTDSPASLALMKRFQVPIRKSFQKVRAFYVGPQALILWKDGKRLTMSAQSPREYDLAP